jgi:hypothetical protein
MGASRGKPPNALRAKGVEEEEEEEKVIIKVALRLELTNSMEQSPS